MAAVFKSVSFITLAEFMLAVFYILVPIRILDRPFRLRLCPSQ